MRIPCNRCGQCCRIYAVTITQEEHKNLKMHVNSEIELPRFCTYCDTLVPTSESAICPKCGAEMKKYLFKDDNERCHYLSKDGNRTVCTIYLHRPQECRDFLCIFVPPHLRL